MQVGIAAVGRLRGGPEADLISDYLDRAGKAGRAQGFSGFAVREVEDRKGGGSAAEAGLLLRGVSGALVAMDERGRMLSSPDLAHRLAGWRDQAQGGVTFVIGGADGLDPSLRDRADLLLSFGPMVWPHMLARVMLAEQLYRAMTILAGTPYHRS